MKRIFFLALWLGLIAAGIFLGTWQLDRMQWKHKLLANLEAAWNRDARTPIDARSLTVQSADILDGTYFIRGTVSVRIDPANDILAGPRVFGNAKGSHWYSLGHIGDVYVWINHGFVADGTAIPRRTSSYTLSSQVFGYKLPDRGLAQFVDDNKFMDMAMAGQKVTARTGGHAPVPVLLSVMDGKDGLVHPLTEKPDFPNNHRSYAIFWFTMSFLAFLWGAVQTAKAVRTRTGQRSVIE